MVFLAPATGSRRSSVFVIWIPTILLRLCLLPAAPSDDVNRYLWEGKLVRAGISPYAQTADAEGRADLRDHYWERMNHKDKPTVYPPLIELTFAAIGAIAYHPLACKLAVLLADPLRTCRRARLAATARDVPRLCGVLCL